MVIYFLPEVVIALSILLLVAIPIAFMTILVSEDAKNWIVRFLSELPGITKDQSSIAIALLTSACLLFAAIITGVTDTAVARITQEPEEIAKETTTTERKRARERATMTTEAPTTTTTKATTTSPVSPGQNATLTAKATPGASCDITVTALLG